MLLFSDGRSIIWFVFGGAPSGEKCVKCFVPPPTYGCAPPPEPNLSSCTVYTPPCQNFSNYSAFHFRSKVLPRMVRETGHDRWQLLSDELDLTHDVSVACSTAAVWCGVLRCAVICFVLHGACGGRETCGVWPARLCATSLFCESF